MPDVSIVIPTYNRAEILSETLSRLPDCDLDVVVTDNASTDDTQSIVEGAQAIDKRIRYIRQPENVGTFQNTLRGFAAASTDIVVYMPDDDSILAEPLLEHVARLKAEPDLVGIYTDVIAWDDAEEKEMHRYYPAGMNAVEFTPDIPTQLLDFALSTQIPMEIGVWRKGPIIKARIPYQRAMPYHPWMYRLSRMGKLRFDPLAFLREHRVLKPHLSRDYWGNMENAMAYIGDEQRLGLEMFATMALQDGNITMNPEAIANVHLGIEGMLHNRASLEVNRACERGDFILAVELRRRQYLWFQTGSMFEDLQRFSQPAAQQALKAYEGMDDAPTLEELTQAYKIGVDGIRVEPAKPLPGPMAALNEARERMVQVEDSARAYAETLAAAE